MSIHLYRIRRIVKTQRRGGMPALRKMMHLGPVPTSVGTKQFLASPAGQRLLAATRRNAGRTDSGQSGQGGRQ